MASHITIVGSGFSGLVAAWSLSRKGFKVQVIEKKPTPGGLISTLNFEGFRVETAANGLLCSKLVEDLFDDCGVEIIPAQKTSRKRYLWVNGEVTRWPLGFWSTMRAAFGVLLLAPFFSVRPQPRNFEPLQTWGRRVFGKSFADRVLATGVWGIFAAPASTLSARLVTRRIFRTKAEKSLSLGRRGRLKGTVSAKAGMGELIDGLRRTLEARGVEFHFETDGQEFVQHALANPLTTQIIIATSAKQAADLLEKFPTCSIQVGLLRQITMLSLVSVGIQFASPAARVGFGTLFSQDEQVGGDNDGILGALQNSVIFSGRSPAGTSSETWILGGQDHGDRVLRESDEELLNMALQKRRQVLGELENKVLNFKVTRWPDAIPHFGENLERVQLELNKPNGPVVLFGNYLGEIGLRSILEQAELLPLKISKG